MRFAAPLLVLASLLVPQAIQGAPVQPRNCNGLSCARYIANGAMDLTARSPQDNGSAPASSGKPQPEYFSNGEQARPFKRATEVIARDSGRDVAEAKRDEYWYGKTEDQDNADEDAEDDQAAEGDWGDNEEDEDYGNDDGKNSEYDDGTHDDTDDRSKRDDETGGIGDEAEGSEDAARHGRGPEKGAEGFENGYAGSDEDKLDQKQPLRV